jgi:ectoine hydroxylase-related dioxygenase (phytanoyl-CoA dioxygenase family)
MLENKKHIDNLNNLGVTILKKYIPETTCEQIKNDYYDFVSKMDKSSIIYTENNKYSRLYNLHLQSHETLKLLMSNDLLNLLDEYFGKKTALNSSIYFQEGSQQCIHRDTPYFWSIPNSEEFVGVWFALEDANIQNGKLEYYTYGHKILVDPIEISNLYPEKQPWELFEYYGQKIEKLCRENNLSKESPDVMKGDIVIWHANLPHGGSIIKDKSLTRNSIVAHYLPENSYIQKIDNFFGRTNPERIMEYVNTINNRKRRNVTLTSFAGNEKCTRGIM